MVDEVDGCVRLLEAVKGSVGSKGIVSVFRWDTYMLEVG